MQTLNQEEPIPLLPRSQAGPSRLGRTSPRPKVDDEDEEMHHEEEDISQSRSKGKLSLRTNARKLFAENTRGTSPTNNKDSLNHALFLLLERPTSSNSAFTLHFATNALIVLRYVSI